MFPYYLAIGMNPQEFWEAPPILARAYSKAHKLQVMQENEKLWMSGLYYLRAINAAYGKNSKYPEKPIDLNLIPKSQEELEAENRKILLEQYEQIKSIHKKGQRKVVIKNG